MREILFRGKRIDNGDWVEGSLVVAGDYCCILPADENSVHPTDYPYLNPEIGTIDGHLIPVDPSTVGQSTGMTDKNGKKIFEGDILSIAQKSNGLGDYFYPSIKYPANVIVKWNKCSWMWEIIAEQRYYLTFPDAWCHFECKIIGNIHDTPELLDNSELLEDKT